MQMGAILAALGRCLTLLLGKEISPPDKPLVEAISDAGRLLADLHHKESASRRQLIALDLNRELKNTLDQAPLGSLLFGDNLAERIKSAKALEKSSLLLKSPCKPASSKTTFRSLNLKSLPRMQTSVRVRGRQRPSGSHNRVANHRPARRPQQRSQQSLHRH